MGKFLVLVVLSSFFALGCTSEGEGVTWSTGEAELSSEEPALWEGCAAPSPCILALFCDAEAQENEPDCWQKPLNSCLFVDLHRGAQCFPSDDGEGRLATCDGSGTCR